MSRRTAWCVLVAMGLAHPVDAQVRPGRVSDEQEVARLLELEAELDAARQASADAVYRLTRARIEANRKPTRSLEVGPLRILAVVEQAAVAEELFGEVWREDFGAVTGSPSLQASTFAFEWWTSEPSAVGWSLVRSAGDPPMRRIEVPRGYVPRREGVREAIRAGVWATLRDDFPAGSPMRAWLGDDRPARGADAYRRMASSAARVDRACLVSAPDACAAALGVGPMSDLSGFTPEQLRRMVGAAAQEWAGRVDRDEPDARACLEDSATPACERVVTRLGWVEMSTAPAAVKAHLLWFAVAAGGDGAWARAIARADASPGEVLAAASAMPLERLVRAWRDEVARQRPDVHAGMAGGTVMVVLWTLVLAAFAMRSTRWRSA